MTGYSGISGPSLGLLTTVAAAGTAAVYFMRPKPLKIKMELKEQSLVIDEKEGIRCSRRCKDGKLIDYVAQEGVATLYENFQRGLSISGDGPCLGRRNANKKGGFDWLSYKELHDDAHAFGSALVGKLNQGSKSEAYIGIYAANSVEWVVTEQACNMFSLICIPLYDTLGEESRPYIIQQSDMEVIVCDTDAKARAILEERDKTPSLRHVIVIGDVSTETRELGKGRVVLHSFVEVMNMGQESLMPVRPPTTDSVATICYTSGTTAGLPKGVILTHGNIVNMLLATKDAMSMDNLSKEDSHLSFLPLAHMFERSVQALLFFVGGRIGIFGGDVRNLLDDAQALKPTVLCVVPRIMNRVYDKVMGAISSSAIKSKMMEWALNSKLQEIKAGIVRKDSFWDYIVFRKVQNIFGGNVQYMVTGSAPVSERVLNFFRAALGCHVYEGYGQTECTAAVSSTMMGEYVGGHVGPPVACNYIKLVDVPDMDLKWREHGRGEVCVKGFNCTQGYFKLPDMTKKLIDSDGWIHTGDVGMFTSTGCLKIVDRIKHLFKLAQGEYVAPEKIEQIYNQCRHVAQVFVDGDSLQTCTVAVVVPDFEQLVSTAKEMGLKDLSHEVLCRNQQLRKMILDEMVKFGASNALKGFEQVKAVHLCPEAFSVESNLLTPTLKSKRPALRKHFASQVADLYKELKE